MPKHKQLCINFLQDIKWNILYLRSAHNGQVFAQNSLFFIPL
jgi:hypothetical protein